jgi:hypothetical protein
VVTDLGVYQWSGNCRPFGIVENKECFVEGIMK